MTLSETVTNKHGRRYEIKEAFFIFRQDKDIWGSECVPGLPASTECLLTDGAKLCIYQLREYSDLITFDNVFQAKKHRHTHKP